MTSIVLFWITPKIRAAWGRRRPSPPATVGGPAFGTKLKKQNFATKVPLDLILHPVAVLAMQLLGRVLKNHIREVMLMNKLARRREENTAMS